MATRPFSICSSAVVAGLAVALAVPVSAGGPAAKAPHLRNVPHNPGLARFKKTVAHQASAFPTFYFLEATKTTRAVALTFDDGPDPKLTPLLLAALAKHNIKATFFLVGSRCKQYPSLVKAIHAAGHAIGGHGYMHVSLKARNQYAAWWHIRETQNVLHQIIGMRPAFYRPPYGAVSDQQVAFFGKRGVRTINWSVDSFDWDPKRNAVERISGEVLKHAHDGAIILLHSGAWRGNTVKALPTIIGELAKRGHTFETIPQLLGIPAAERVR